MKNDMEIVLELASSREIKKEYDYKIDFSDFFYKYKNNRNIVLAPINTYESNLLYISNKIKNNRNIVLSAIK